MLCVCERESVGVLYVGVLMDIICVALCVCGCTFGCEYSFGGLRHTQR